MKSKGVKPDSYVDIKPPIASNVLSYLQIATGLICLVVVVGMLYAVDRPWFAAIMLVIIMAIVLILVARFVATVNDSKQADKSSKHLAEAYPESQATREQVTASYETLEARGREQLAREKEAEEAEEV